MIELFAELSSGRDSDICLRAADLRELEDIHRELRQLQEQGSLCAGCEDDLPVRIHRRAAELGELFGQIVTDAALAAVFGICLIGPLYGILADEGLKAAGDLFCAG